MGNDNKIEMAAIKDEFRDGLRWAHELYAEGLIDPGAFTQSLEQMVLANSDSSDLKIGVYVAGHLRMGLPENDRDANMAFDALPPLKGPSGEGHTLWSDNSRVSGASFIITDNCKNPEAAIRYLDYWIMPENFFWNWMGDEGINYVPAEEGQLNYKGEQALIYDKRWDDGFVNPNTKDNELEAMRLVQSPSTPWQYWEDAHAVSDDIYSNHWWTYDIYRLGAMTEKYEPFVGSQNLPLDISKLWTSAEQSSTISQLRLPLVNYIDESIIGFITGSLNIDTDWDSYVNNVHNLQLDTFLETIQDAYDTLVFKGN